MSLPRNRLACVVGVGVNCESAPSGAGYPTARLKDGSGRPADRGSLFQRLAIRFDETLAQWEAGAAFETIRALWLERSGALGEHIRIENAGGRREGTFGGLDPDGRLLFRGKSGIEVVEAADLWILPASDGSPGAATSASRAREGRT